MNSVVAYIAFQALLLVLIFVAIVFEKPTLGMWATSLLLVTILFIPVVAIFG